MSISTEHIKELVMSGFIEECSCNACQPIFPILSSNSYLVYRIVGSSYYMIFYQNDLDWWSVYYNDGYCINARPISNYVSFEDILSELPLAAQAIAVFNLDILIK